MWEREDPYLHKRPHSTGMGTKYQHLILYTKQISLHLDEHFGRNLRKIFSLFGYQNFKKGVQLWNLLTGASQNYVMHMHSSYGSWGLVLK